MVKTDKAQHDDIKDELFQPAYGLRCRHIQTIIPALRKSPRPKIEIEQFELHDSDFVECYWHPPSSKPLNETQRPIVVLFHGLEGSFDSAYIKGIMNALNKHGFSSVLMHFRGCSGKLNRLPRSYHSGDTADARSFIESVNQRYPDNKLFSIGFSLGGNMLLKLLGEWGKSSPICAAVSVSAPLQLELCANQMNQGFSRVYQYALLKTLKAKLIKKYKHFDMSALIGIDEKQVNQLNSFWEFDNVYTGPIHGFNSASDYYQQSSSKQYLKQIETETLIIHALDDPFMPPDILSDIDTLPANVKIEAHAYGGHLGFISGSLLKPQYWLENHIVQYFKTFSS